MYTTTASWQRCKCLLLTRLNNFDRNFVWSESRLECRTQKRRKMKHLKNIVTAELDSCSETKTPEDNQQEMKIRTKNVVSSFMSIEHRCACAITLFSGLRGVYCLIVAHTSKCTDTSKYLHTSTHTLAENRG